MSTPQERLRHHVTGAIERGEAGPIIKEVPYDVTVENHGTLHLVRPETDTARDWLRDHCPDAMSWGGATVVEPRYTVDLLLGMQGDGLVVPLEAR